MAQYLIKCTYCETEFVCVVESETEQFAKEEVKKRIGVVAKIAFCYAITDSFMSVVIKVPTRQY